MNEKFESSKLNLWELNKQNRLSSIENRNNDEKKEENTYYNDRGSLDLLKKHKMSNYHSQKEEIKNDKNAEENLSVDPRQSWEQIKLNKTAYLIDVRSEPETIFNGKPDLTDVEKPIINIPYKLYPSMRENPKFKETYKKYIFNKESTAFLICKDGTLSEKAANEIREFHDKCFAIKNGFDGERDDLAKKRGNINGWKADGLPWEEY